MLNSLNINKDYPTHSSNYTAMNGRTIKYIVVHYTGGTGTALQNAEYYQGANREASAHFFVGHASENAQIYQGVDPKDKAWHAPGRNTDSIGIEVCCHNDTSNKTAESLDWYFDPETVDRLIELVRALMAEYGIDIDHIIRHYDVTGKICPAPWVHDEAAWLAFKQKLEDDTMTGEEIYKALTDYLQTLPTSDFAKKSSEKGVSSKVFSDGDGDGLVDNPQGILRRQELAVVLNRLGLLDQ